MAEFEETCEYEVEVVRQTPASVLVILDEREIFIPLSQICDSSEITEDSEPGDEGTITISEWLAIQEGLE